MTTITHAGGTISPTIVDGYTSRRDAGNIVHPVPHRPSPDVTFRPATLRTGTLRLVFDGEAESKEAEDVHATGTTFALTSEDRSSIEMVYVAAGAITRELEDATRDAWIVTVGFQEILT